MNDNNANKGILVTTSWFGKESRVFAANNRIDLIEGRELKALLLEHRDVDVLIRLDSRVAHPTLSTYADEVSEPVIAETARKHGIADEDMTHAYRHPMRAFDMDNGLTMLIGGDATGHLLEIGVAVSDAGEDVIIYAMPARKRFLR